MSLDVAIPTAAWASRPQALLDDLSRELRSQREFIGRIMIADKEGVFLVEKSLFDGLPEVMERSPDELNGPAINRNKCLPFIKSEWVVFLDDDVRLVPGWGDRLVNLLQSEPKVDLIGGQILAHKPGNWFSQAAEDFVIRHKEQPDGWYLAAAHLVVRSDALRSLEGFDRSFIYAGEDWDLSKRAIVAGYSVGVTDQIAVTHQHPTSLPALMAKAGQYGKADGLFGDSPLGAAMERQKQASDAGFAASGLALGAAITWPFRQFREFRGLGRSRIRSARSTVLYIPWMFRYLRNSRPR